MRLKALSKWSPGEFLALDVLYVAILIVLLISRQAHWLWIDRISNPIGGIVPLGVPWFGALGGVTISIYGVVDHNDHWQGKWGLWHAIRPVVGAILGTLAYLIFIGFIQATGTKPSSVSSSSPKIDSVIYLVIAFVVGFRESTFRNLVTRVVDTLLTPGDTSKSPGVSISPSPVDFGQVAVGNRVDKAVTISNPGTAPLVIKSATAAPPGVAIQGAGFSIEGNPLSGATVSPSASAVLTVRFAAAAAGAFTGTLTVSSNAGNFPVALSATGQ